MCQGGGKEFEINIKSADYQLVTCSFTLRWRQKVYLDCIELFQGFVSCDETLRVVR